MNWNALKEPVPDNLIKQRQQGGATLDYIEWHVAADLLDQRAPGWEVSIRETGIIADKVFVRVAITIEGVTRENIGCEDANNRNYGDALSNSYAMAFKRAAAMFGIARELYHKDALQQQSYPQRQPYTPRSQGAPPSGDGITPKQVAAIKAMCIQNGIDVAQKYPGLTELNKREASQIIGELQKEQETTSNYF